MSAIDLVARLREEADLCRNETATDIATLLDEAADALDGRIAGSHVAYAKYVNDFGITVRAYESALGGVYHHESTALAVSDTGPVHALVRFSDVADAVAAAAAREKRHG